MRRGGAEISSVHANFLVNLGDATTADVLALMSLMREASGADVAGCVLEPEVRLLGLVLPLGVLEGDPQGLPPSMDEKVRERRRSVSRERGRRRGRTVPAACPVVVAAGAFLWLRSSDVFAVETVTATATEHVTKETGSRQAVAGAGA